MKTVVAIFLLLSAFGIGAVEAQGLADQEKQILPLIKPNWLDRVVYLGMGRFFPSFVRPAIIPRAGEHGDRGQGTGDREEERWSNGVLGQCRIPTDSILPSRAFRLAQKALQSAPTAGDFDGSLLHSRQRG